LDGDRVSSISALLARGREAHELLMLDTVRLVHPGTERYDPVTGVTSQPDARQLYAGMARVKPFRTISQDVQAEERAVVLRRYDVDLPWSAAALAVARVLPGDRIEVTGSPDNPRLVGMVLWVTSVGESATATAWRLSAEDRS